MYNFPFVNLESKLGNIFYFSNHALNKYNICNNSILVYGGFEVFTGNNVLIF
jgi:hypothetical protein